MIERIILKELGKMTP